jgi:hypothetical protein
MHPPNYSVYPILPAKDCLWFEIGFSSIWALNIVTFQQAFVTIISIIWPMPQCQRSN